jgi:hypothetical protein
VNLNVGFEPHLEGCYRRKRGQVLRKGKKEIQPIWVSLLGCFAIWINMERRNREYYIPIPVLKEKPI